MESTQKNIDIKNQGDIVGTRKEKWTPSEDDVKDGITYDKLGRMQYHPDFHPNHGKPFTDEDKEYLCMFYETDNVRSLSFALGKTEHTLRVKYNDLKQKGKIQFYKNRYLKKLR